MGAGVPPLASADGLGLWYRGRMTGPAMARAGAGRALGLLASTRDWPGRANSDEAARLAPLRLATIRPVGVAEAGLFAGWRVEGFAPTRHVAAGVCAGVYRTAADPITTCGMRAAPGVAGWGG